MNKHSAILFDFDGVLARTMEDNLRAWQKAFRDFGGHMSAEEYFPLEGMPLYEIAALFCKKGGIDVRHEEEIVELKEMYYRKSHTFAFYPSVLSFVAKCNQRRVPLGIVTAGLEKRIQATVPEDFLAQFQTIITSDMYLRGKPYPDPYVIGAEKIGFPVRECIVVENAPLGIQSAKSAGAYCVAVTSTLTRDFLRHADVIIERFDKLGTLPCMKAWMGRD